MVMGSPRACFWRSVRSVTRRGEGDDGPVYTLPCGCSDTVRCTCHASDEGTPSAGAAAAVTPRLPTGPAPGPARGPGLPAAAAAASTELLVLPGGASTQGKGVEEGGRVAPGVGSRPGDGEDAAAAAAAVRRRRAAAGATGATAGVTVAPRGWWQAGGGSSTKWCCRLPVAAARGATAPPACESDAKNMLPLACAVAALLVTRCRRWSTPDAAAKTRLRAWASCDEAGKAGSTSTVSSAACSRDAGALLRRVWERYRALKLNASRECA